MSIKQRDHFSWSQLITGEKDQNLYYEVYVLGFKIPQTPAVMLGKWVADELKKKKSKNKMIEQIRMFIPKGENRELKFECRYKGIKLLSYFDDCNEIEDDIIEIKTGSKGTQSMVDKHGQLDFYSFIYWLKHNRLPKRVRLIWLKTKKDINDEPYLTGEFKVFIRKITMADIIKMSGRILKDYAEIQQMYQTLQK